MKHTWVLAAGAIVLCSNQAAAQEKRFQLAVRSGYSLPMGYATSAGTSESSGLTITTPDLKMSNFVSSRIPIWIDAGYMVTRNLMLGVYFQYGFASVKSGNAICAAGADCSGHDLQYGIQAHYYFMPDEALTPWFGLGFGRESASIKHTKADQTVEGSLNGWTYALLQAGADFKLANNVALGPFVALSIGQYTAVETEFLGTSLEMDVPKAATHEWFTFGAKGQLGF